MSDETDAHRVRLAEAQLATIGEIVSGIAHDIGTPLNVISGYAESMLMSVSEDEALKRKQIASTIEQTHRIARLVRQMLDIVRPAPDHAGRSQPLEQFTADLVHVSSHMLRRRDVRCRYEMGDAVGVIAGNLPRLYQAMFGVLRGVAQVAGPKSQIVVRPAPDAPPATAFLVEATDGAKQPVDLSSLADGAAQDDVIFARTILAEHGGGLELARDDAGPVPSKLVVRLGSPTS